ncbi:hypothetical protein V7S43_010191 [Phytophthora oleae]|uniref:Secreted protein n=1 Tax=Phytophthora oleae TaxID=2107226 RepID=A0ABD3FF43_9STRA
MITKPLWRIGGRLCWVAFCFIYKWADIAKANIKRYRRFVSGSIVLSNTPAECRWKLYGSLANGPDHIGSS